ncbi:pentapeptide repeat-containing protein [Streptomyces parvus]|uniref:pentapeptide repeat-containing protein n=1 Tax=Streptomyces parvus TaxID=66428 RepID=UPI0033D7D59E
MSEYQVTMAKGWFKRAAIPVGIVAIAIGAFVLLWKGPWLFDGSHLRKDNLQPADGLVITGFRTMVVAIIASTLAGLGLLYTHVTLQHTRNKDAEQATLVREGQMTDRYATAIELIAASELTKRLGGIYALERIMRDSPKDHETIVEVLAAFVREHAPRPEQDLEAESEREYAPMPEHVQAALTVLGRRPERSESFAVNLRNTDLRGLVLPNARLRGVNLRGAFMEYAELPATDLTGAQMEKCHLENADLTGAVLTQAILKKARLYQTSLDLADLSKAKLNYAIVRNCGLGAATMRGVNLHSAQVIRTDLERADLSQAQMMVAKFDKSWLNNAILTGALLHGTDLSQARDLEVDQVLAAKIKYNTKLPPDLLAEQAVAARVSQAEQEARKRARMSVPKQTEVSE